MRAIAFLSIASGFIGECSICAQNGQPHSLKADVTFQDVTLSWKAPADEITLQWHDGEDYNGLDGILKDPQGAVEFYAASKFTPGELAAYAGQTIDAVKYWEYREIFKASVVIFENGEPVYEQAADLTGFEKNTWRNVKFDKPYTIPADKEVMIAVRYSAGRNMSFVAICDRTPTYGKGNLYSYDGKKWYEDCPGDFLITAVLHNEAAGEPQGYNVYRDGAKANAELLTGATSYTLTGEPEGQHKYQVSAVYASGENLSAGITANTLSVYGYMPPVAGVSGTVDHLAGTITWSAPLKRGPEMTWSGKELGVSIGGTSSTAPKVWIIQQFSPADLAAFPDHQITAVNAYVKNDGTINGVTAFVMKNGEIDYFEEVGADAVAAITPDAWNKFAFAEPYKMELGNEYAFGLYYTHTAGGHPVGVDNTPAVEDKGNTFSTSSPSSKGFAETSPYWKTLSEGDIAGNFMLTADVEALSEQAAQPQEVVGYDVYRDGQLIAADVAGTTYVDNVPDLGTYSYAVVAKGDGGKTSEQVAANLTYTLPEEYKAPVLVDYAQEGKDIAFSWSPDAYELKHYGTATYAAGFAEEMSMLYGAKFSKDELAGYAGYKLHSLTFGIGDELDGFKLKVLAEGGEVLYEQQFAKGEITPQALYSLTFDAGEDVRIPEGKDLYLVYDAVLPAGSSPIMLDAGPEVDGGAVINLAGGVGSWLKLGTIASEVSGMNIVIGALAVDADSPQDQAKAVRLGSTPLDGSVLEKITLDMRTDVSPAELEFGIAPDVQVRKAAPKKAGEKPEAKSYRIYRNGEMAVETEATAYAATLDDYGVFNYYVTTVYENGWESPASDVMTFTNTIAQRAQAPYDLRGTADGNGLKLEWKPVDDAPELTYDNGSGNYLAFGMTGGSVVEGYMMIKFPAAEIADKVGQEVSHISFRLNDTNVLSAAAVVMYGDNIVYMQDIDLSSLSVGANTVRLDKPVPVMAGQDVSVGYFLSYNLGVKPLVCDDGPNVASYYSDLISSSASPDYWKSMKENFGFDYNWAISATLKTADQQLKPMSAPAAGAEGVTYTVYRDGTPVQTGVTGTSTVVENAESGVYTVTATVGGEESAESNSVEFDNLGTGITEVATDGGETIGRGPVYGVDGQLISNDGDPSKLQKGVYIMNGKKFVVE